MEKNKDMAGVVLYKNEMLQGVPDQKLKGVSGEKIKHGRGVW